MQCKEGRKGFVEGHTETRGRMKLDMTWYDKVASLDVEERCCGCM